MAYEKRTYTQLLYRLLQRGQNGRSFYEPLQVRTDIQLLSAQRPYEDYASEDTKKIGKELIAREIENIPKEKVKAIVKKHLYDIEGGQRDFRF